MRCRCPVEGSGAASFGGKFFKCSKPLVEQAFRPAFPGDVMKALASEVGSLFDCNAEAPPTLGSPSIFRDVRKTRLLVPGYLHDCFFRSNRSEVVQTSHARLAFR